MPELVSGWYWIRYTDVASWAGPREHILGENGTSIWVDFAIQRGKSYEVGPYIPTPPLPKSKQ